MTKLSAAKRSVLKRLASGELYLYGPEVQTARALERDGLLRLEDNGQMATFGGRVDGERWCGHLTGAGEALAHDLELQAALSKPIRCECPEIAASDGRVRQPNESGNLCRWCGLQIGGPS